MSRRAAWETTNIAMSIGTTMSISIQRLVYDVWNGQSVGKYMKIRVDCSGGLMLTCWCDSRRLGSCCLLERSGKLQPLDASLLLSCDVERWNEW